MREEGVWEYADDRLEKLQATFDDPHFREAIQDPKKIEMVRQMIVGSSDFQNIKLALKELDQLLHDPVEWREKMTKVAELCNDYLDDEEVKAALGQTPSKSSWNPFARRKKSLEK
jgi:hypothetical protein